MRLPPLALLVLTGCGPSTVLPPTVETDPQLPRLEVRVQQQPRTLHVREWGDRTAPVVLIVHGSVSDVRSWVPIAEGLSERFHVVAWDLGGNGLSQRLARKQLAFEVMAEEVLEVKRAVSPTQPVAIIGHSWGAAIVALALGKSPGDFSRVALAEPPGLTGEVQNQVGAAVNLLATGYLDMALGAEFLAPVEHESLDLRALEMLSSGTRAMGCDPEHPTPLPVWRPGGLALIEWETSVVAKSGLGYDYDFTVGLEHVDAPVLLIGSECSAIGTSFQQTGNLPFFRHGRVEHLAGVSHRMMVDDPARFVDVVKRFLEE